MRLLSWSNQLFNWRPLAERKGSAHISSLRQMGPRELCPPDPACCRERGRPRRAPPRVTLTQDDRHGDRSYAPTSSTYAPPPPAPISRETNSADPRLGGLGASRPGPSFLSPGPPVRPRQSVSSVLPNSRVVSALGDRSQGISGVCRSRSRRPTCRDAIRRHEFPSWSRVCELLAATVDKIEFTSGAAGSLAECDSRSMLASDVATDDHGNQRTQPHRNASCGLPPHHARGRNLTISCVSGSPVINRGTWPPAQLYYQVETPDSSGTLFRGRHGRAERYIVGFWRPTRPAEACSSASRRC